MLVNETDYEGHEAFEYRVYTVNSLLSGALLVIGVVGALGYGSNRFLGGLTLGLSATLGTVTLCGGPEVQNGRRRFGDFVLDLISAVALSILGYLAFKGSISTFALSWCIIGPTLARIAWKLLCCPCAS